MNQVQLLPVSEETVSQFVCVCLHINNPSPDTQRSKAVENEQISSTHQAIKDGCVELGKQAPSVDR